MTGGATSRFAYGTTAGGTIVRCDSDLGETEAHLFCVGCGRRFFGGVEDRTFLPDDGHDAERARVAAGLRCARTWDPGWEPWSPARLARQVERDRATGGAVNRGKVDKVETRDA